MKRFVGLMGGTFDPIHIGHLRGAIEAMDLLEFDELRLVPCAAPVHKETPSASAGHRLAMLELALAGISGLTIDTSEIDRDSPSWTIDTVASVRQRLGAELPLCLIVGMDSFVSMPTWKHWRALFDAAHVAVFERPGSVPPAHGLLAELLRGRETGSVDALQSRPGGHIFRLRQTCIDISATEIRRLVAHRRRIDFLVPRAVADYIERHGLYRS